MNCNATDKITYRLQNSSTSDLTLSWPLGCTPDVYKKAYGFVICTPNSGIVPPKSLEKCDIAKAGFIIACMGNENCPVALYANNSCGSKPIATATVHLDGVFDNINNMPGSGYQCNCQKQHCYCSTDKVKSYLYK